MSVTTHSTCENCDAVLHGEYCHACGQSVHNPIRHAGHAIEEFFEAFWHLDGRLWRTLRDLMAPGRVADNYLAGHRARYIPPLRLFVVLSVLTFFIGALTVHVEQSPTSGGGIDTPEIARARTVAEVERERDRLLDGIAQARRDAGEVPGMAMITASAQERIQEDAAKRIAELRGAQGAAVADDAMAGRDGAEQNRRRGEGRADGPAAADVATVPPASGGEPAAEDGAWNPQQDPVDIDWLPQFANDWLTRRMGHAMDNIERMDGRPDLWLQTFMAALPSALFVLVPVFALLLKLGYFFKRRLYLEHLVVALYSHAFLLAALLVLFLLAALRTSSPAGATALKWVADMLQLGIMLWMPVYLLLMQKRVYRQGWPLTGLKYLAIGTVYFLLLATAAGVMFVVRLSHA